MQIIENGNTYTVNTTEGTPLVSVGVYSTVVPVNKYQEETLYSIESIEAHGDNEPAQRDALLHFFEHFKQTYGRHPGIDNHFSRFEYPERQLLASLIRSGKISERLQFDTEFPIATADASSQKVKYNLAKATCINRIPNNTYSGFLPQNATIVKSFPRDFKRERTAQLLRQIATQLFHFCCYNKVKPVEVQVMLLDGALYISANKKQAIELMQQKIPNTAALKEALTTAYAYGKKDKTDIAISKRHAQKLATRLYVGDFYATYSDKRALQIKNLCNQELTTKHLVIQTKQNITLQSGINFVSNDSIDDRHAEETLLDIMQDNIDVLFASSKPAIYGKKRPCNTCHSRLNNCDNLLEEEYSIKFDFNPRPGLLYKQALYQQKDGAAASLLSLGAFAPQIYISTVGDSGYATVSDSEIDADEVETITTPLTKLSLKPKH